MSKLKCISDWIKAAVYTIEVLLDVALILAFTGLKYTIDALGFGKPCRKTKVYKYLDCFTDRLAINVFAIATQVFDLDINELPTMIRCNAQELCRKYGYEL